MMVRRVLLALLLSLVLALPAGAEAKWPFAPEFKISSLVRSRRVSKISSLSAK